MAVQKKAHVEPSCPLWLATYGDMVTNMLVFFVLLLSMSEIKKDERFIEFMQAVREAFGYVGGIQQLPLEQVLEVKNVDLAQMLIVPIRPYDMSNTPDEGVKGKESTVTHIRRGERFADGGKYYFPELSAELTPENEELAAQYGEKLRGYRTQIEVRAHCSRAPLDGTGFDDHYDLAFARARAVGDALIRQGVNPDRLLYIAVGVNEPVVINAYSPAQRHENDRVEVFQVSRTTDEVTGLPPDEPITTQPADPGDDPDDSR